MTLKVRALPTKCGNLRLIPRNLIVEGENHLLQAAFTHNNNISNNSNNNNNNLTGNFLKETQNTILKKGYQNSMCVRV